jgi:hypothetical protein
LNHTGEWCFSVVFQSRIDSIVSSTANRASFAFWYWTERIAAVSV